MRDLIRQALNLTLAVAQILVSAFAGREIGPISDRHPTYVVPAGYAFSIWGLIFILSLAYAIYQMPRAQRANPLLRRIGWSTAAAFLANCVWMLVFPRGLFVLSVAVIVALLASLIFTVAQIHRRGTLSTLERWLVRVNFSIFLGWVAVATAANIAQTLTALNWGGAGLGGATWGVAVLLAVGAIAAAVTALLRGDFFFAATVVWALTAVLVNQLTNPDVPNSPTVAAAAGAAILLIAVTLLISGLRRFSAQSW